MRRAGAALCAALALWPSLAPAQEQPAAPEPAAPEPAAPPETRSLPDRIGDVPGTWDLSRDGSNRRCVMTLSGDSGEAGRRLYFPAGCRRALPVIGPVAGWLYTDSAVRLVDRNVRPVLLFTRRPDQRSLVAKTESGESYSFVPLDIVAMRPPEPEKPDAAVPPGVAPAAPTPAPQPGARAEAAGGPTPGIYALDRFQDRDTCRLSLDGAAGTVRIVPGCHDGGLEVFDPVRWRYAGGRMTLTAKRGHSIDLIPTGDGRWRRDPEVGTTFVLRRVDP
ncbi:AprI/Inh family metalloprotease inhibitor [Methylobacterium sp. NEAU 140]|uniref:AprI/Inh family metalloprotease inhibitor n=1 Tax=Methylobacterium sp. NEAU 140 TaxID=3064945 RepID=UPI002736D03B|nr:AprI/Inh family metalloprotease inhibitor [Methylobacterium sp. NEAU 140]MDP4024977.1 AprI/Inh family metalloprotease inhibitor [Methylobacterium sp. NEAU 140]